MTWEDAVSPVIGLMLILTILVSAIALLNATYIPGLKQQSEIDHLAEVEEAFMDISSDIERIIAFGDETMVRERLFLGGGEVIFSGLRSSGTLRIDPDIPSEPVTWMVYENDTSSWQDVPLSQVSISYQPIGNFWQNQGYIWHGGLVNVTKGDRTTWLSYVDQSDADEVTADGIMAASLIACDYTVTGYLDHITISPVSMVPDPGASFTSSNGVGTVTLHKNDGAIQEFSTPDILGISIDPLLPCQERVRQEYIDRFTEIAQAGNCDIVEGVIDGREGIFLTFDNAISPVTLTVKESNLVIGAS